MNLIKIKDIILDTLSGLDENNIKIFNNYLRGRYVHAVNWNYILPLEEADINAVKTMCDEISKKEKDINDILADYHWMYLTDIQEYIDQTTTLNINDINKYISYNAFIPADLTTDDLKKFRTWLASTILSFNMITDDKTIHMLKYYANGMYDDVIEGLSNFGEDEYNIITDSSSSSCGCNSSAQTLAQLQDITLCQPLSIYRTNIYKYMIEIFSDMYWWMDFDPEFLTMFKTYIDNIIKANFSFSKASIIDDYVECGCRLDSTTKQNKAIERLNKLSEALKMMINNDISGHKNYINTALTDWSTYLYENMEW